MPKILCAGLITVDLIFYLEDMPQKGSKSHAKRAHMIAGGGALIAASAVARLGGAASLCGAIGDDPFGSFLRAQMALCGIDDRHVRTLPGTSTSGSAIIVTPDGERTIINHRPLELGQGEIDLPVDFAFDAALVDTRFPELSARVLHAAKQAGKPAVIDGEAPVYLAENALRNASHVIFSAQGLADYAGGNDAPALTKAAHKLGTWCAVTRGEQPVLCHDGLQLCQVPVFEARAVNTLGAGDVWHGAFTLTLAGGDDEHTAVQRANAAAAIKVARPIDQGELPTAKEVDALLSQVAQ